MDKTTTPKKVEYRCRFCNTSSTIRDIRDEIFCKVCGNRLTYSNNKEFEAKMKL